MVTETNGTSTLCGDDGAVIGTNSATVIIGSILRLARRSLAELSAFEDWTLYKPGRRVSGIAEFKLVECERRRASD